MKWIKKTPKIPYKSSDSIIEQLAKINGVTNLDKFLYPSNKDINDSHLLVNVEQAANAICLAVSKGLKIAVSYDV